MAEAMNDHDSEFSHRLGSSTQQDPCLLLVWDAPNMDMGLGLICGQSPYIFFPPAFRCGGALADRSGPGHGGGVRQSGHP